MDLIKIYSDGGSRGNPGPGAYGFVIYKNEKQVFTGKKYLGKSTNNIAEYEGLKNALQKIIIEKIDSDQLECYLDSELIVKQLNGIYKIKTPHIKILYLEIIGLLNILKAQGFKQIKIMHIKRELNKEADSLVNQALNEYLK